MIHPLLLCFVIHCDWLLRPFNFKKKVFKICILFNFCVSSCCRVYVLRCPFLGKARWCLDEEKRMIYSYCGLNLINIVPLIVWCRQIVWSFGFFVCLLCICYFVGSWRGLIIIRLSWLSEVLQLNSSLFVEILNLLWLLEIFVSKTNLCFWALSFFE